MKLILTIVIVASAAAVMAGCGSAVNTNVNVNVNARNSNTAVLTTATPTPVNRTDVTREEYDRTRADYEKDRGTSTIGQGVNDSWLWFKTKATLAATNDLRDSTINVDVVNDVITLKGTVGTQTQKTQAETMAKTVDGQKGVKNQLTVKPNDSMTNQMVNGNSNKR